MRLIIKILILISGIAIIMFATFTLYLKRPSQEEAIISPNGRETTIPLITLSPISKTSSKLQEKVDAALRGTKGTYGIAIKNLKNGEAYYINEHKIFQSGSLYKLWIMATVFEQIQKGLIKEDEILTKDIVVLNEKFNIASESAETNEGEITLSVKDALEQTITISHNYAALLLSEKVRLAKVAVFLKENGFSESTIGEPPKTSAFDIALFFEKLYQEELANSESTDKMLALLKRQTFNNKLPKYLPQDTVIAHKTGEIDLFTHDAGIVFGENGDYIIVILSESDFPTDAEERIANVSKAVFDYFTNKL